MSTSVCSQLLDVEEQLRQARFRRNDIEHSLQEAMTALRTCHPPMGELYDIRQSRVRELEKKLALETVRCEELQLELTSLQKNRINKQQQQQHQQQQFQHQSSLPYGMTTTGIGVGMNIGTSYNSGMGVGSTVDWGSSNKHCDIDKIVAKIEQDNRMLADLEHSRPSAVMANPLHTTDTYSGLNTYAHQPIITCQPFYSTINTVTNTSYMPSTFNPTMASSMTSHIQQPQVLSQSYLMPQHGSSIYSSSFTNPLLSRLPTIPTTSTSSSLMPLSSNQYYNSIFTTSLTGPPPVNSVTFSNPIATHFRSPLSVPAIKPLTYENMELMLANAGVRRSQTSGMPHHSSWTLSGGAGGGLSDMRSLSRILAEQELLAIENEQNQLINGYPDDEVDLLELPGRGKFPVYVAKLPYEPDADMAFDELKINAGDYVLVWNELPGPVPYFDAETVDGRRGLIPAHYMQRIVGEDLQNFRQSVMNLLSNEDNYSYGNSDVMIPSDLQRLSDIQELNEIDADQEEVCEIEPVPPPRLLMLEKQLNKSVLISWTHPEPSTVNTIDSYHVYVDGVLKATIKASERTRALIEGVDSNKSHRISVRSVTVNRRTSKDAACTILIGKETQYLGPSMVKASHITSTQAVITWLPANSNHYHIVCVNNVEVRTVKPSVFRHVITGLTPNTNYRVAVKPRLQSNIKSKPVQVIEESSPVVTPQAATAYTDFKTLPKGLPDPPSNVNVEPGPQDGTLLVTWNPVKRALQQSNSIIGYSVYADGKKVTDIESPTGDHALVDISKLLGLNPRNITVRTKSRDGHSLDSNPLPIPFTVLRSGTSRTKQQIHASALPQVPNVTQNFYPSQQQTVLETEENLSDKEVYPNNAIYGARPDLNRSNMGDEDFLGDGVGAVGRRNVNRPMNNNRYQKATVPKQIYPNQLNRQQPQQQQPQPQPQQQQLRPLNRMQGTQSSQKRPRWFVALYDYNPTTMSSDPEASDEELKFSEGDKIMVWGDKDADGYYWGELRGKRGFVPHNMLMEIEGGASGGGGGVDQQRDKYAKMPLRKMVALYDYDPQELSPNVDNEAELSFAAGTVIDVYGDIDEAGFFEGEINGVRGLVPSNFLSEITDDYNQQMGSKHFQLRTNQPITRYQGANNSNNVASGSGMGARGPPPPPRDNQNVRGLRKTDACPVVQNFDTTIPTTSTTISNKLNTMSNTQQYLPNNFDYNTYQQPEMPTMTQISGAQYQQTQGNAAQPVATNQRLTDGNTYYQQASTSNAPYQQTIQPPRYKGAPNVVPSTTNLPHFQNQQQQQPNIMQKFSEMTTPGGDILSKGKELIFMKFGLGNNAAPTTTGAK